MTTIALKKIKRLCSTCPLTLDEWSSDQVQDIQSQALEADLIKWHTAITKEKLDRELSPKELIQLEVLLCLRQTSEDDIFERPLAILQEALTQGTEQACLRISTDKTFPEEVRERFSPQLATPHTLGTYLIPSCDPELFLLGDWKQHLQTASTRTSAVYKPRHQYLNGIDGEIAYTDGRLEYVLDIPTKTLWCRKNPNLSLKITLEEFDGNNPPPLLRFGRLFFQRMGSSSGLEGTEFLRERLYHVFLRLLENKLKGFLDIELIDAAYPPVSFAALKHRDFGKHHQVGVRRPFLEDAQPLGDLITTGKRGALSAPLYVSLAPADEFWKIAVPSIILAMLDTSFSHILVRDSQFFQVGTSSCLPYFRGVQVRPNCNHNWMFMKQARLRFSADWKLVIGEMAAEDILKAFHADMIQQKRRFPKLKLELPPECKFVLMGGLALLQESMNYDLTAYEIGSLQTAKPQTDQEGKMTGLVSGEFWMALSLAAQEAKYDYRPGGELPEGIQERIRKYLQKTLERVWGK